MASNLHFCKNNQKCPKVVVVIVPFLAQGHLNQLLQLSCLIASYNNIKVHYVSTKTHNLQAKLRVMNCFDSFTKIHFHEFPTPNFISPNPNPNPNSRNKFPSHLQPSFESSSCLRNPVKRLIQTLSSKYQRVVIINDSLMGSVVQDYVSVPNAEAYAFHSVSAFTSLLFMWERKQKLLFSVDPETLTDLPSLEDCFSPEFEKLIKREYEYMKFNSGKIYNTCKVIEGPFLDLLSKELTNNNEKQWALGPFNPVTIPKNGPNSKSHHCLLWLEKQEPNSVLYVSFGTTVSFSDEQIKEMAIGLEESQQKFVWVLRDADKGNVFTKDSSRKIELPKEFEERVKEKGILVRDWAPQLEILSHCSIGGFLSHCGWNSCMESISMGVPIAAWPMHSDQPRNTVLITEILKIGIVVKEWANRNDLVKSNVVKKSVEKLMASKEGDEMRNRAKKLSVEIKKSVAEDGIKRMELDSFISHITR